MAVAGLYFNAIFAGYREARTAVMAVMAIMGKNIFVCNSG
jgi:hypothetical protein